MRIGIVLAAGVMLAVLVSIAACTGAASPTETPRAPEDSPTSAVAPPTGESPTPTVAPPAVDSDPFTAEREALVETGIIAFGIEDPAVIEAIRTVPRHRFVPDEFRAMAYNNHPLPIGYGQTISQPYIVALMTEALELKQGDRVLEIGTGSGYQAAVLSQLGMEVYSIEIVGALHERASSVLEELGYEATLKHADGYFGWEEAAPFDAIIVTAAPDHVPQPLLGQLKEGGLMVIPVGPVGGYQELWSIRRIGPDEFTNASLGGVTFVPFVREAGSE